MTDNLFSDTIRLRTPLDIVDTVPYLLGFHPHESLVAVAIKDGGVEFSARVDLDGPIEGIWLAVTQHAIERAILVAYSDSPTLAYRAAFGALTDCPTPADALWVSGSEYGAVADGPDASLPLPTAPTAAAAACVAAGMTIQGERVDVAQLYRPMCDEQGLAYMWSVTADMPPVDIAELLTEEVCWSVAVRFATAVSEIEGRDTAWLAIDQLDSRAQRRAAEQLREVARRVPAERRVPVLFLSAWAAWRSGDGTGANIATELTMSLDPDYSAGKLLMLALQHKTDPRRFPPLELPATA